jgi:dihydrofolate synthase/folylpolyglutamate synthase
MIDKLIGKNNCSIELINQTISYFQINPNYPIILIGGTNGKGSTVNYITNILMHSGYKVGTFTSPHVFRYNERITINQKEISDDDLNILLQEITKYHNFQLGLFKTFFIAAHKYFIKNNVDIAVFEVGIGGKNDITNFIEPTISAITCVDLDHCHILGNTIEEIGLDKAHIYRSNKYAFFGDDNLPGSILNYCVKNNVKLQQYNKDFGFILQDELNFNIWGDNYNYYSLPHPCNRGIVQMKNFSLAVAILKKMGDLFPITLSSIKTSLVTTKMIGRFEVMPGKPQFIFDVAHNPQAVKVLIGNLLNLKTFYKKRIAIFGISEDKDYNEIIKLIKNYIDLWYIAKISSDRGVDNVKIYSCLLNNGINSEFIKQFETIGDATRCILTKVNNIDNQIIAFGSFLVVDESYSCYREIFR